MLLSYRETFQLQKGYMNNEYIINGYKLDNSQQEIIKSNSNTLIIAGAGAGKTLTILGKVKYLIENDYCMPDKILMISFTNASVDDIKRKINYSVDAFTFHKLSINILKAVNFNYSLCSDKLLKFIIKEKLYTIEKKAQKLILKFLKINNNYNIFLKSESFNCFCNFIATFINLYKANNYTKELILNKKYTTTEKRMISIIFDIYYEYLSEKKSCNLLDFDDLIIYATEQAKTTKFKYKYIIIDEFQDTSFIRLKLIESIYNNSNAKIIVVGDDWQSIYRFSGCDLNIFLKFENFFKDVKKVFLEKTYRNSNELIKIASSFIQKNPLQIKKDLNSCIHNNIPIIFSPTIDKKNNLKMIINYLLRKTNDIMILGRNNQDILSYIDKDYKLNNEELFYNNYKLKYLTIHKSKGLEAEYVIIINCDNSLLGIPNKIEENQIISKVFPNLEIKYAEERRIFYVALTRCKKQVFLIYDKNKPSIFIKELKKICKKELKKITYF